ncbi:MAG: HAD-IA family hydrolase [Candidatus Babeliaceae bacterium]|nr:HAD-IA family hydrolase [Candidatus Babeliaceae bacterium]
MVKKYLFIAIISLFFCIHTKNDEKRYLILWDLGDALVYVSYLGMAAHIGLPDLAWYHFFVATEKNQIQNLLFDVLEEYGGKQEGPAHEQSYHTAHRPLPKIFHEWLAGKILNPKKLVKKIHRKIDQLYGSGYFKSNLEYRVAKNGVAAMFNPEALISNTYASKEALEIVQEIALVGKHQQTILSNWDGVSYEDFKASPAGRELSRYFNMDDVVISGLIKRMKPQQNIFEFCFEKYKIPLENWIFIDDQLENVDAARRYGITAIHVKNHDFRKLRKELKLLGIL